MYLIEVSYRDQCRRIIIVSPYSFQLLINSVMEKFGVYTSTAGLKYMDPHDRDWITLSTDQELVEALSLVDFEPPVLHMELFLTPSKDGSEMRADNLANMCPSGVISDAQHNAAGKSPETCYEAQAGAPTDKHIDQNLESKSISFNVHEECGPSDENQDFFVGKESAPVTTSRAMDNSGNSGKASDSSDSQFEDAVVVDDRAHQVGGTDEALARLMDMGFDNTAQVHTLLRLHRGDVDAVLEALLSS
jgi:hypothetical protein